VLAVFVFVTVVLCFSFEIFCQVYLLFQVQTLRFVELVLLPLLFCYLAGANRNNDFTFYANERLYFLS